MLQGIYPESSNYPLDSRIRENDKELDSRIRENDKELDSRVRA